MHIINAKVIILRVLILAILFAFVYPFLPDKQKWQIQASVGIPGADSLLAEYYDPPPADDAMQFSLETFFSILAGNKAVVDANDVRFVRVVDKLWGNGRLWEIHLRRGAIDRLQDYLHSTSDTRLKVSLGDDWDAPFDLAANDVRSPIYVDPALWSSEPYFVTTVLEGWYERPYMGGPGMASPVPGIM
ncbi:MAG: hypothetical protein Kow0074_21190 [Candidatus Zixiibacteriota bacterium]